MAVKSFQVDAVTGRPTMAEGAGPTALFAAVQTAMDDALAVSGLDAVTGATTAVTAIGTASAAVETALNAHSVTLLVNGTLTKAQIFKALDDVKAHLNTNTLYT
jgi:hypothetical protein